MGLHLIDLPVIFSENFRLLLRSRGWVQRQYSASFRSCRTPYCVVLQNGI